MDEFFHKLPKALKAFLTDFDLLYTLDFKDNGKTYYFKNTLTLNPLDLGARFVVYFVIGDGLMSAEVRDTQENLSVYIAVMAFNANFFEENLNDLAEFLSGLEHAMNQVKEIKNG